MPFLPPASIAMLVIVMRSSIVERLRAGTLELHGAIGRAVEPDLADAMENDVLGHHAFLELAFEPEPHRLRNLEQQLARAEHEASIGIADARGEFAESARHARVRVGSEENFAGAGVAFGGQRRMADTRETAAILPFELALGRHRNVQ